MLLLNVVSDYRAGKRFRYRVLRFAVVKMADFVAPPLELGAGDGRVGAFIDDIIDFAAVGVERGDRAAALGGQEEEAVIKAGPGGYGFLLAVFVWGHFASEATY